MPGQTPAALRPGCDGHRVTLKGCTGQNDLSKIGRTRQARPNTLHRMFSFVAVVTLAVAATPRAEPLKLATGGFTYVGINDELRAFVPEHLSSVMRAAGVVVVTPNEVATLLGRERQRQLLGCADNGESCTAELAGALGADGVVLGELAAVGDVLQLNLKVVSDSGRPLATWTKRVQGVNRLLDALDEGAKVIAEQALAATGHTVQLAPAAGVRRWWWLPSVSGALVGAAGGVLLFLAKGNHDLLTTASSNPLSLMAAARRASDGELFQTFGFVAVGVGAAGLVTGALLWLFGDPANGTSSGWRALDEGALVEAAE
jgi:hypothetical protein